MNSTAHIDELNYLDYFGLRHEPFPVAPDDENFFISTHIDTILTEIIHGIKMRKGFMVLAGDIGLGKTTISRRIMRILEEYQIESSLVIHTSCRDVELLREINRDFGIETKSLHFGDLLKSLNDFLIDRNQKNINCSIIIDDAQNLDQKSLELIRMISNFEADRRKLVQILLIGQPELTEKLNASELRQLKSRVIIWKHVKPLTADDLYRYLVFKLNVSGSSGRISISKTALRTIYRYTGGNLRQTNKLMDRCLYAAFLHDTDKIERKLVKEACLDLEHDCPEKTRQVRPFLVAAGISLIFIALMFYFIPHTKRFDAVESLSKNKKSVYASIESQYAVNDFLKNYGLTAYEQTFQNALKNETLEKIEGTIFKETGLKLVQLENAPYGTLKKGVVLNYKPAGQKKESFLLFWKPRLTTENIYYGYKDPDIGFLQNILSEMGLYQFKVDSIVGMRFIKAIIVFQQQMGLSPTGHLDNSTLFLLCNINRNQLS